MKITEHFSRIVVPFSFNEDQLENTVELLDDQQLKSQLKNRVFKTWERFEEKEINKFFLPHIVKYLNEEAKMKYLYRRRLNKDALNALFGFLGKDKILRAELNGYAGNFEINNVELYLFFSGIGFLIMEVESYQKGMKEITNLNYALKHISGYSPEIRFELMNPHENKINYLTEEQENYRSNIQNSQFPEVIKKMHAYQIQDSSVNFIHAITFGDLIDSLLTLLPDITNANIDIIGHQLPIFTFVRTPNTRDQGVYKHLYYLKNVYKESYIPDDNELVESHDHFLSTFKNITFGFALEGTAVIVHDTDHPFLESFSHRVRSGYFIMYLLALHKRVASILFRLKIENVIPTHLENIRLKNKYLLEIQSLRNKIMSFYFNSYFTQVTNNSNYEKVFKKYLKFFDIEILITEIKKKSDELDELIEIELNRKSTRLINRITIIGGIFAPLSVLVGFFGMNMGLFYPHRTDPLYFKWIHVIIPSSIILIVLLIIILVWRIKKSRRMKRKSSI